MKTLFLSAWLFFGVVHATCAEEAYQLLRSDPTGFAAVTPDKVLKFPRDHLPHKDYRIEWWYLTANLRSELGEDHGVHWTLFRQSMSSENDPGGWQSNQVWMAHTALSLPTALSSKTALSPIRSFVFEQRFARGGIDQADVRVTPQGQFSAWLDDWQWQSETQEPFPAELKITSQGIPITLQLDADTPWVLQGQSGYSQKSETGQASYYYSQPHIQVTGTIEIEGRQIALTGEGWLDREWSSQPLAPNQPGWDWLSLHLEDGNALMVYRLRQKGTKDWVSGSWIDSSGQSMTLGPEDINLVEQRRVDVETPTGTKPLPLYWQIKLPGLNKQFDIAPVSKDHWLDTAFPYWEGPVTVSGASAGRGYLELTGY